MISNTEWINTNRTRSYPFMEGSSQQERYVVGGEQRTIPDNFIVDMRMYGAKPFVETGGTYYNVDYFLYKLERIASTSYRLHIREIQREIYNESNSATFEDVGYIDLPWGAVSGAKYLFVPLVSSSPLRGFIKIDKALDSTWPVGIHEFLPEATTFESRAIIPRPGDPLVTSIGVLGDSTSLVGDVKLDEGTSAKFQVRENLNTIRLSFVEPEPLDCTSEAEGKCEEDNPLICDQPALMTLNGVEGNHIFTAYIEGRDGLQASALTELSPGGNPFNPSDYYVRGIVITYHGMITAEYIAGNPDEFDSYKYGLECETQIAGTIQELNDKIDQIEQRITQTQGQIP